MAISISANLAKDWRLKVAAAAFLVWAVFLVSLDPSEFAPGIGAGARVSVAEEVRRILLASALGSLVALLQVFLMERFPVAGRRRVANLAIHLLACPGLSAAMIVIAHILAPLVLAPDNPRLAETLERQLSKDVLLIALVLGIFVLVLHLTRGRHAVGRQAEKTDAVAMPAAVRIPVQTRNGVVLVDADAIDWIEAQGNYAALHVGAETHLVRETLTRLCARLDPQSFVRIHRSAAVNIARVKQMTPVASGDAQVRLVDGVELRASRTFASALREKLRRPLQDQD